MVQITCGELYVNTPAGPLRCDLPPGHRRSHHLTVPEPDFPDRYRVIEWSSSRGPESGRPLTPAETALLPQLALLNALESAVAIANEAFLEWDNGMRAGKLLMALAGQLPRYRSDVDAIHETIKRAAVALAPLRGEGR